MRRVSFIIVSLVLLLQTAPVFSQQETRSRDQVLSLFRESILRYKSLDLQATIHTQFTEEGKLVVSTESVMVRRQGSRALISDKSVIDRPGKQTGRTQLDFIVEDNGDVRICEASLDPSLKQVAGRDGLHYSIYSQRLAGKQAIDRDSVYSLLNDAAAVVWVIAYTPLLEYLDRAKDIQVVPVGSGAKIVASGEMGRLTLAVSPSSGWLPQSFELVKEPQHQALGGRVADIYNNQVTSVLWTGEIKGFKSDPKANHVPTEMQLQRKTIWKDRQPEVVETKIRFDNVILNPTLAASDFNTTITFPVGFPVGIRDADTLPYKWDGSAVVPGVPDMPHVRDKVAYKNLKDSSGGSRTRTFLVLFNIGVVTVIAGVILWRRARSSR